MTTAHQEIAQFIGAGTTPQEVLEFQASPATRHRASALIQKERDARLLPEEQSELDDYLQLEHLLRLAKAHAHRVIGNAH